jgi:hypothetical protein
LRDWRALATVRERARGISSMLKTTFYFERLGLLLALGASALTFGCASRSAAPTPAPPPGPASVAPAAKATGDSPVAQGPGVAAAARPKLQACYDTARARDPELAVHTVALFFAREGKVVFADVELPQTPELARCLGDALVGSAQEGPSHEPGALGYSSLRLDFGPPASAPPPPPTLADLRARHRRIVLDALRRGALRESDPPVREVLNPPPPSPTAAMQAELDACHKQALAAHPGLVLQRHVIYLARGRRMLLADVNIPEAPELARCVVDRIVTWSSPFSEGAETVVSGLFIHLGGPERLPDAPAHAYAELARRDALVQRALQLGLISADDPLLARLKRPQPGMGQAGPASAPPPH